MMQSNIFDWLEVIYEDKDRIMLAENLVQRSAREILLFNNSTWASESFLPLADDFVAVGTDDLYLLLISLIHNEWLVFPVACDSLGFDNFGKEIRFGILFRLDSYNVQESIVIGVCIREVHMVPTMQDVSYGLRWNEREYFELFGIYSAGHNQLQRLTTDYKARGHPLRKDFPATGYREVFLSPFRDIIEETKAEFIQEYRSYEFYITWEKYLETFLVLRPDLRFEYDIGNDVIERLESLIDSRHYIYPEDYDPFEDSDTDSDREMVDMALIEKKEKKQPVSGHDTTADTSDSEGSDEEEVITDGILDAGRRRRRRRYDSSSDDSTTESSSSSKELSEDDDWPNDGSDAESSSSSDWGSEEPSDSTGRLRRKYPEPGSDSDKGGHQGSPMAMSAHKPFYTKELKKLEDEVIQKLIPESEPYATIRPLPPQPFLNKGRLLNPEFKVPESIKTLEEYDSWVDARNREVYEIYRLRRLEDIRTGRINPEEELRNFLEKSLRLLRNEPKPEEPWQVELHVTLKKWGETMDEENKRWNRYRLLDDKFGHDAPTIEPIEENGMLDYMNRRWMAKQVKSNAALATGYHEYFKIEKKNDLDGEIKKQEDSCSVDESSKTSYKYGDSGNLESSNNDTIVKFYTNRSTNIAYRQINVYDVAASAAVAAGLTWFAFRFLTPFPVEAAPLPSGGGGSQTGSSILQMRSQYWRTLPAQDFHVFIDEMVKSAAEGKPPVKVRTPSPDTIQGVHYHIELLGDKKQSDYYYRLWKFCVRAEILDPERYPYTDAEDFQARLRIWTAYYEHQVRMRLFKPRFSDVEITPHWSMPRPLDFSNHKESDEVVEALMKKYYPSISWWWWLVLGAAGLLAAGGIYYYKTKGGGGGGSGSGSGPSDGNNGPRGGVGVSITAEQLKEFYEQCERALKIQKSRRST